MNPKNSNRFLCHQDGQVLPFAEMVRALERSAAEIRRQDAEATIIAWVNFLRSEVLRLADLDQEFFSSLKSGDAVLRLKKLLMPMAWREEQFGNQISLRTGLPLVSVCSIFQEMSKVLRDLAFERAFEPVGWFEVLPREKGGGFLVYLWDDFPQPVSSSIEKPQQQRVSGSLWHEA